MMTYMLHTMPGCDGCKKVEQMLKEMKISYISVNMIPKTEERFAELLRKIRNTAAGTSEVEARTAPVLELETRALPYTLLCDEDTTYVKALIQAAIGDDMIAAMKPQSEPKAIPERKRNDPENVRFKMDTDTLKRINIKMRRYAEHPQLAQQMIDEMTPEQLETFVLGARMTRHSIAITVAKTLQWKPHYRELVLKIDPYMNKKLKMLFDNE